MLKLGHIRYSNCIPVHGRFLACGAPPEVELVHGVPAELNRKLARGDVDVAPASSIEFARHAERYRILPGLSISAASSVRTIQLVARGPLEELRAGTRIAVPTASATSVALVKIVVAQRLGIRAEFEWFDQSVEDPLSDGVGAALYIGDAARARADRSDAVGHDLGAIWRGWTGLPFVFALWQTSAPPEVDPAVRRLAGELVESRAWSRERLPELAERYAGDYGWPGADLLAYWRSLEYGWDEPLAEGLREFYRRAAAEGLVDEAPEPVFLEL